MAVPMDIVVMGSTGSGKTSLVQRFLHGTFDKERLDDSSMSSGAEYYSKLVNVSEHNVKFKVWDTSGQQKYRFLLPMYYKSAHAAIVVFDVMEESGSGSFDHAKALVRELKDADMPRVIALVATRCDVDEEEWVVLREAAESFATFNEVIFTRTSALNGKGVQALFGTIASKVIEMAGRDARAEDFCILGVNVNASAGSSGTRKRISSIEIKDQQEGSIHVYEEQEPFRKKRKRKPRKDPPVLTLTEAKDAFVLPRNSGSAGSPRIVESSDDSSPARGGAGGERHVDEPGADGVSPADRRPAWVADELAHQCARCGANFTVLRRKHHCRCCGKVMCGDCSSHFTNIPHLGYKKAVRVCTDCHENLNGAR